MTQSKVEDIKRIAIYSRKSKFTGKGESIENQIELCKQYIRTHYLINYEDNIIIYEDEGFSGGNTDRPRFKMMMTDAKTKRFSMIVCYRLDRISRNIGDFAKLIEELDALHIAFISIKEQFDTSSPMGRAMMYISSVFSQLERETIAERIRDNMHELAKTGRWLGGTSPTGYISENVENVTVNGKIKKACKLQLVTEEAKVIQLIFKIFLETNSLSKTESYFIQNGYKTKNAKTFTRFTLKNILTNPVYMVADGDAYYYLTNNNVNLFADISDFIGNHGVMAYNRTIQKAGRTNQIRPMNEWIVAVGKHTGIISGAEWVKAQELLSQNRLKSFRKPRSHVALLSGLLYCACGDYMRPKASKQLNKQEEQVFSYLCVMKEKSRSHICKIKNINGNRLDEAVWEEIERLGEDTSEFIRQLELGKRQFEGNQDEYPIELERLRTLLAKCEKEIETMTASLIKASGTSAEDYIIRYIDELHSKGQTINHRITELESQISKDDLSDIDIEVIQQMLSNYKSTLYNINIEQKRTVLRSLIKKSCWDGERIHVYLFGFDDDSEF